MRNEILLILNLVVCYSMVLLWMKFFGKKGLMVFNCVATVAANIEVLILIEAFGMEQTLGNVLFAATFLITDILSEVCGKKDADKAVNMGILTTVCFVIISQWWLYYIPSPNDVMFDHIKTIFSNTPRVMLSSLLVYAIVQKFDVWLYHKIWQITEKTHEKKYGLWLRNNGSTLCSQLLNSILFNVFAFAGVFDTKTLISVITSCYVIFIVTSLADTPFVYIARKIYKDID